jgi:hypothetical protein
MQHSYPIYHDAAQRLFPTSQIHLLTAQGGCSATFLVLERKDDSRSYTPRRIIQFREARFGLDLAISAAAVRIYGKNAPATRKIHSLVSLTRPEGDILCYDMDIILGVPYSSIIPKQVHLAMPELERQANLVREFADFVSKAWPISYKERHPCEGKVGCQISQKLQLLATQLPTKYLRSIAKHALDKVGLLESLPVVLNHGDVVPGNIMVEAETGEMNGMVDWAEAEYLPFGTCLYGVEYLFGAMSSKDKRDSLVEEQRFQYYSGADKQRQLFWHRLRCTVPALNECEELREAVILAKLVGTLLWYGFAWDDGAIDRVVNVEDDGMELMLLESFIRDDLDRKALR